MKIFRDIIVILLAATICQAQNFKEEDKLKIFEIMLPDNTFGTGFMVDDSVLGQVLITCKHIIMDSKGEYFEKIFVRNNRLLSTGQAISDTSGFWVYLKEKIKRNEYRYYFYPHPNPQLDLAIIPIIHPGQTIQNRKPIYGFNTDWILSAHDLDSLGIDEGTDVEVIGFSITATLSTRQKNYHFSRFGKIGLYTTDEYVITIDDQPLKASYLLLDMRVRQGDSGSPIIAHVNGRRYIVGMVSALVPEMVYGVGYPSSYIYDFLQDLHSNVKKNNRNKISTFQNMTKPDSKKDTTPAVTPADSGFGNAVSAKKKANN